MARPEVGCVIHTHTIAGCAVSMQKDGLLPLNQHALQVIGDVAYHDYEGTGRNPEERARFLADFGDRHIMVLRNHGLLIVGTSIAAAFIATYRMERACAMQLAFQQSGAEFNPIDDEVVSAAHAKQVAAPAAATIRPSSNGRPCCASSTASTSPISNNRARRSRVRGPARAVDNPPGPVHTPTLNRLSARTNQCRRPTWDAPRTCWPNSPTGWRWKPPPRTPLRSTG